MRRTKMTDYVIQKVEKDKNGYKLTCSSGEQEQEKVLPILNGFEPRTGDVLEINRRSKGEVDLSVNRGDHLLVDFHIDRKKIQFSVYHAESVDKYMSGSLEPNAVRRVKYFSDHCHNVLETKMGKIKARHVIVAASMIGCLASVGTDPDYEQYLRPEEIRDPCVLGFLACGTTALLGGAEGFGRDVLDSAARKYIQTRGIKVYGPAGKVSKIIAGLDHEGNPTGSFYNKNLVMARGGRNG